MSFPSLSAPTKTPKGYQRFDTMDPMQKALFQQLLGGLGGQGGAAQSGINYLQQLLSGSPESSAAFERPFMRQFEEQTIPGLAERFSSMGAGGQRSSAFGNALSSAAGGLQENLASLRGQLQMQALPQLSQLLQGLLGQSSFGLVQKEKPWWQSLLTGAGQGLGQAGGAAAASKFLPFIL